MSVYEEIDYRSDSTESLIQRIDHLQVSINKHTDEVFVKDNGVYFSLKKKKYYHVLLDEDIIQLGTAGVLLAKLVRGIIDKRKRSMSSEET